MIGRERATAAISLFLLVLLFGAFPVPGYAAPSLLSGRAISPAPRTDSSHRLTHPDEGSEVAALPTRAAVVRAAASRSVSLGDFVLGPPSVPHYPSVFSLLVLSAKHCRLVSTANGVTASRATPRAPPILPTRQ